MFDLSLFEEEVVNSNYDNIGAYNQLQLMMRRGDKLTIKFYTSKHDQTSCAWIESKSVAGFRYILKPESINGILDYMTSGDQSEFDISPNTYDSVEDDENFQKSILMRLIENGITIQWTPLFREYQPKISGLACFKMGKIMFRLERNDEILSELREYKQAI